MGTAGRARPSHRREPREGTSSHRFSRPFSTLTYRVRGWQTNKEIMMERPWFMKTWAEPSRPSTGTGPAVLWGLACLLAVFLALQAFWVFTAAPGIPAGGRAVEIPAHHGPTTVARRL